MCIDTTYVEHEMHDHTNHNWWHRKSNKIFLTILEAMPRKHSTDSLHKTTTWNITHNTESTAV